MLTKQFKEFKKSGFVLYYKVKGPKYLQNASIALLDAFSKKQNICT